MSDPLRNVRPGEDLRIPAPAWNALMKAARAERNRELDQLTEDRGRRRQGTIVPILNDTGMDLPERSVVGLDGPLFTPSQSLRAFLNQVALVGVVPTADHEGRFGVTVGPVRAGHMGHAWIAGTTQARVEIADPAHTHADVNPGDVTALVSVECGSAKILWADAEPYGDPAGYADGTWATVRIGSKCGGSGAGERVKERCQCPEDEYEVMVGCGPCGDVYGVPYGDGGTMPKYWVLSVLSAESYAYGGDCEDVDCSRLVGERITLAHQPGDGYYDEESCTWAGNGACLFAELTLDGDEWVLTLLDAEDRVVAVLRMPADEFDCCGPNGGWTLDESSCCQVAVLLEPHECTCCPDRDCPPDGVVICPEKCGCADGGPCEINVVVDGACLAPECPQSPGGCDPEVCETTPGCECVQVGEFVECVQTLPGCGVRGGHVKWRGGCRWDARHEDPGRDVSVEWTGVRWEARIEMDCGATCVFYKDVWDCYATQTDWTYDPDLSSCPGGEEVHVTTFRIVGFDNES